MEQQDMKFVERFEMAVMQFVMLQKASQGGVTRENLQQSFQGNLKMKYDHFEHCLDQLVSEEHLVKEGNKFTISDDGREDLQQLERLVLEMQDVIKQGGSRSQSQQGGGMTQKSAAGGSQGGTSQGMGGSQGGMTGGNAGGSKGSMGGGQGQR